MNDELMQLSLPLEKTATRAYQERRSIEQDFPVLEVSRLAQIESYRKNIYRPAYYIHKWWARRTGATFRAILLGVLLPEGESPLDFFYQANTFDDVVILDPFMGGGTTIGEALRLGAKVIGVDINPVSWFLVKKVVEPVSLKALDEAYSYLERRVAHRILSLYETTCPICGGPAHAVYVYWVKLVPCRSCGRDVPLRKSMILARHMSKSYTGLVTCPACGHPYISETLDRPQTCPKCGRTFDAHQGFSKGAYYTCPVCKTDGQILQTVREQEGPPQHRMVAIYTYCRNCGRNYKKPDQEDIKKYEEIKESFKSGLNRWLYPSEPIPQGYNTKQMMNYNYRFWFQMFNERQLTGLSVLLEGILSIEDANIREFMLLLFSGTLEFNNMFCSAKGLGTGSVRHIFAHHAFIPAKEPLEANLWGVGRSSGGFSTLYWERLRRGKAYSYRPVERRLVDGRAIKVPIHGERLSSRLADSFAELMGSSDKRALLLNKSSTDLREIPDRSVDAVVTDPPYLDNVMYSELSDFFYVWLRLGLKDSYPGWERPSTTRAEEAIWNSERGKDTVSYRDILTAVFRECHRVLKDEGLMVFTFHHGTSEAWDSLAYALKSAKFTIVKLWPVYAEMDVGVPILMKKGIRFDSILVCRKAEAIATSFDSIGTSELLQMVRKEVETMKGKLESEFELTEKELLNLSYGVVSMFFTQGRTEFTPSKFERYLCRQN